jgi:hypothetical protein
MITNLSIGSYGRLGNQIFQYASAFTLAKYVGTDLLLPNESEQTNTMGRYNPVINQYDYYNNDLFRLFDLKFVNKLPLSDILPRITNNYNEPNKVCYFEDFWSIPNDTNLHGYFQAKQYVDKYEDLLRTELKFNDVFLNYGSQTINELKKKYKRIISLHIRRGDGLMDSGKYAHILTLDYYNKIIADYTDKDDIILVFSDDIDWCKTVFEYSNLIYIDNRYKDTPHLFDFTLMSMCDVNIMAVSTYSWWAAWLKPNGDKIIIVPDTWWGTELKHNCEEPLRYDNWIKIKA